MSKYKDIFDIRIPITRKYHRSNHSHFMNKNFSKAITDRARLRNGILRTRSNGDEEAYHKQWNYCELYSLIRKTKQGYYNNFDHRKVAYYNHFGNISNLFFSGKSYNFQKITLVEKDNARK